MTMTTTDTPTPDSGTKYRVLSNTAGHGIPVGTIVRRASDQHPVYRDAGTWVIWQGGRVRVSMSRRHLERVADVGTWLGSELEQVVAGYRGLLAPELAGDPAPVANWVDDHLDELLALDRQ